MRVLKLDATYTPIEIVDWTDAFKLVYLEKAEVIDEYENRTVSSPHRKFTVPSIIRVNRKVFDKNRQLKFSRHNVFLRDSYTCQYCGGVFNSDQLTLDHVLPLSKGGPKTWENIVTSCSKCNCKKDDKIPKEAGMKLLREPYRPAWTPKNSLKTTSKDPEKWKEYMRY